MSVEDGPGGWGLPTNEEITAIVSIIDFYLPISADNLSQDDRISLEDTFNSALQTLRPQVGSQANRPQMVQFKTMEMMLKTLRSSPDVGDHTIARVLQVQLNANLKSLRTKITSLQL